MTDDHTVAAKALVDIIARMACRPVWSSTLCGDQDYLAMRQGRTAGIQDRFKTPAIRCQPFNSDRRRVWRDSHQSVGVCVELNVHKRPTTCSVMWNTGRKMARPTRRSIGNSRRSSGCSAWRSREGDSYTGRIFLCSKRTTFGRVFSSATSLTPCDTASPKHSRDWSCWPSTRAGAYGARCFPWSGHKLIGTSARSDWSLARPKTETGGRSPTSRSMNSANPSTRSGDDMKRCDNKGPSVRGFFVASEESRSRAWRAPGEPHAVWQDVRGRVPHDFRRTPVRNMERAGVPRKVAMTLVGHRTESMYRRYDIVTDSDLHAAAVKLNTAAKVTKSVTIEKSAAS